MLGLWSYIGEVRSTAEGDSGWIHSPELIRLFTLATCTCTYESVRHPPLRIRSFRIESTEPAALGMFVFTHNTQRCRRAYPGLFSALSGPSSPCDSAVCSCVARGPQQVPYVLPSGRPRGSSAPWERPWEQPGFESAVGVVSRSAGRRRRPGFRVVRPGASFSATSAGTGASKLTERREGAKAGEIGLPQPHTKQRDRSGSKTLEVVRRSGRSHSTPTRLLAALVLLAMRLGACAVV